MSSTQPNKAENPIKCISCGGLIGKGFIVEGSIELACKCGSITRIIAKHKPEGRSGVVSIDKGAGGFVRQTANS